MDQAAALTTGGEPGTPLDVTVVCRFVFACAGRAARMAWATGGRPAVRLASDDGHRLSRRRGFMDLPRLTIWEHNPINRHER